MKLQVFNKGRKQEEPVTLSLREMSGGVEINVVDDRGGVLNTLLRFNTDGTITLAGSVNTEYGFKQRGDGSIIVKGSNY